MPSVDLDALARLVDHTNLHAYADHQDLTVLCNEARVWNFASVAVNQAQTRYCVDQLQDTDIHVAACVSFPLGQTSIFAKIQETRDAIDSGAHEIDYVVNVAEIRNGNWDYVREEMESIVSLCREGRGGGTIGSGTPVISKVIFENCYLTDDQKIELCHIASDVRPDFIKTSTGFGTGGATLEDVRLMRKHTDSSVKIKAAGGIRTPEQFLAFANEGVDRIGCSASVDIFEELARQQ